MDYNFIIVTYALLVFGGSATAEDSLQGALDFVNQRQQELANDYRNNYLSEMDSEQLEHRKNDLERALLKYLQRQYDDDNRVQSSPFRERSGQTRAQHHRMLNNFLMQQNPSEEALQSAYKRAQSIYDSYYGNLGWNSVGLRKRRPYNEPLDIPYDKDLTPIEQRRMAYFPVPNNSPVAKRSSNDPEYIPATDPRVEKELEKIFNPPKRTSDVKGVTPTKKSIEKTGNRTTVALDTNITSLNKEKPLEMKKKSIKWSDYFGIDRRKKSENMDNEWLIERYNKANDITKKSNMIGGAPIKLVAANKSKKGEKEASRLDKLDGQLKDIEETIIDDTLKFTGAHDDVDSREMQEIKDSIISRLATAYNVERMRQALKEYRDTLPTRQQEYTGENNKPKEEKRVSVARKQAVDEDRAENVHQDNRIKCTDADENCNEQNYKLPAALMEGVILEPGQCGWIERACHEVLRHWSSHAETLGRACHMHQMCMLCGDNSWFSPTRQCNVLFLSKADRLCEDDNNCQRAARDAVKYLQHISRNIDMELISNCHLECPDKR